MILEEKVLNLGFGFVPTPSYNVFRTRVDLFKLIRQLKLRSFFGEKTSIAEHRFRTRSTFTPAVTDHRILTFEKVVLRDIETLEKKPCKFYNNLTQDERRALEGLSQDKSIVIKPADKGVGS